MPMTYHYDAARDLVVAEAWGVLTDDDVLGHKAALLADPAIGPTSRQLSDIRRVETLAVTPAGVSAMVDHDRTNSLHAARPLALVVPPGLAYGMARMYQLRGDQEGTVGVFTSLEEAEAWLGLAPPG